MPFQTISGDLFCWGVSETLGAPLVVRWGFGGFWSYFWDSAMTRRVIGSPVTDLYTVIKQPSLSQFLLCFSISPSFLSLWLCQQRQSKRTRDDSVLFPTIHYFPDSAWRKWVKGHEWVGLAFGKGVVWVDLVSGVCRLEEDAAPGSAVH